jgi:hypothetical protein
VTVTKHTPALLLLALVSLALPVLPRASAQPASTHGTVVRVTDGGVRGDGKTDNAAALQALVDAATGPTLFYFPSGEYLFSRPVFFDKPHLEVQGSGRYLVTARTTTQRVHPLFVWGLRQVEKVGKADARVTAAHRPDSFGVLDRSAAPERGRAFGYATLGQTFAMLTANAGQLGAAVNNLAGPPWDYWAEMPGFTLEALVAPGASGRFAPNAPLVGLGTVDYNPAPWFLFAGEPGSMGLAYKLSGDNPDVHGGMRIFRFPVPATGAVRLRVWVDFERGEVGAWVNGREVRCTGQTEVKGKRFLKQRGAFPFWVGTSGEMAPVEQAASTDLVLHGLRLSRVAKRADAGSDAARYFAREAETILQLTGQKGHPRNLEVREGPHAWIGTALIFHNKASTLWLLGGAVRDMTVAGGSPSVALGNIIGFTAERCDVRGHAVGLGSIPMGTCYPVTIRDVGASGGDTGVFLYRCARVLIQGLDIEHVGNCYARFEGCDLDWTGGIFSFSNGRAEAAIDVIGHGYGGRYVFRSLVVDSEDSPFRSAVIRCEMHPYTQTSLTLDNIFAAQVGKDAAWLLLRGGANRQIYKPAYVRVIAPMGGDTTNRAALDVQGPGWFGEFDARLLPVRNKVGDAQHIQVTDANPWDEPARK